MIKEVFQNQDIKDTKPMYDKISMLVKAQAKTNFLKPGESFIISNQQWKDIQECKIKAEQAELLTDQNQIQ